MGKSILGRKIYLIAFTIILLTQGCVPTTPEQQAILNEITLVNILSEKEQVVRDSEVFLVSSCDGSGSKQYTGCVAGTKNHFTLNLSAEAAGWAGIGYKKIAGADLQGKVQFGAEFGLDFSRESNHTIELAPPPPGQAYRYTITKEYKVKIGDATAKSASGEETTVQYSFQAGCHCSDKKEVITCEEAAKLKNLPSSVASTTSVNSSTSTPVTSTHTAAPDPALLGKINMQERLRARIVGKWQPPADSNQTANIEFTNDGQLILGTGVKYQYQIVDHSHIRIVHWLTKLWPCLYNVSLTNGVLKLTPDSSVNYIPAIYGDYIPMK